jgi:predicted DNA-binding transcriptional regulator AlpA
MKGNRAQPDQAATTVLDTAELVGAFEIAALLGWERSTVANWAARYDDFPKPVAWLHAGRVWRWSDVLAWAERTGRGPV